MSAARLFHTLRFLRFRQMAGQIRVRGRRLVEKPTRFASSPVPPYPGCRWNPRADFLPPGPQSQGAEDLLRGHLGFMSDVQRPG